MPKHCGSSQLLNKYHLDVRVQIRKMMLQNLDLISQYTDVLFKCGCSRMISCGVKAMMFPSYALFQEIYGLVNSIIFECYGRVERQVKLSFDDN